MYMTGPGFGEGRSDRWSNEKHIPKIAKMYTLCSTGSINICRTMYVEWRIY